ncbi:MAG TPA: hypothetical protein VN643_27505 [Pyrinomonadaceae bacterium]|nr:hypothetical protein [Pyrinomonadaceae bacterium]
MQTDFPGDEREVFPGIHERRRFLSGSMATALALAIMGTFRGRALAQAQSNAMVGAEKLAWDDFLKQALPVAQQLIARPEFSVDEYLYRIGSLATRLNEIPDSKLGPYTSVDKHVWFGPSFRGTPFFIIQWRMEPGAVLPAHNHPNASVCSLGYAGEVRLRNFEIVGEPPDYSSTKPFQVRESRNEMIAKGRISTLSPTRDNIHCFQTGKEGARGIDINTLHGAMGPFRFLNISEKAMDLEKRIYEATWNASLGQ